MDQPRTKAPELGSLTDSVVKLQTETCHMCSVEETPKGLSADTEREAEKHLSPEPPSSPSQAGGTQDTFQDGNTNGSSCQDFLRLSPGKEVMKEMSRVKREVCLTLVECVSLWMDVSCTRPPEFSSLRQCCSAGCEVRLMVVCVHTCQSLPQVLSAFPPTTPELYMCSEKGKMLLCC